MAVFIIYVVSARILDSGFINLLFFLIPFCLDAIRLIRRIRDIGVDKADMIKRFHFQNVAIVEIFTEAIPSVFILTVILVRESNCADRQLCFLLLGYNTATKWIFFTSFGSSILSAAFGMAR